MPGRSRLSLVLCGGDRVTLERWARSATAPQRTVLRSRIVLLLAGGLSAREAARRLGISRHTADLWRTRFIAGGCDALTRDLPGRGRKRTDPARRADYDAGPPENFVRLRRTLSPPTGETLDDPEEIALARGVGTGPVARHAPGIGGAKRNGQGISGHHAAASTATGLPCSGTELRTPVREMR